MKKVKGFFYQLYIIWVDLFTFLQAPNPYRTHIKVEKTLIAVFSLLILDLLFSLSIQSLIYFFIDLKLIPNPGQNINQTLRHNQILKSVLNVVFIVPFLEEFIFRWHLRKVYATTFFLAGFIVWVSYKLTNGTVAAGITVALFIILFLLSRYSFQKRYQIWRTNYGVIFYCTAFAFAYAHISNYKSLSAVSIWSLLYVLPQLFGAAILGYLRIKHGFWYGLLLHVLFNLIAFTGLLLSK